MGSASLSLKVVLTFVLLVLIRITVPRMKLESLSKLGWKTMFTLVVVSLLPVLACWVLA